MNTESRVSVIKCVKNDINYSYCKTKYFELVAKTKLRKLTRKYYQNIIKILMKYRRIAGCNTTVSKYYERYEVITRGESKPYLIKRRKTRQEPMLKCLPLEDSFDVFHNIHMSHTHPGKDTMLWVVKKFYLVHPLLIKLYILCCPVCSKNAAIKILAEKQIITDKRSIKRSAPTRQDSQNILRLPNKRFNHCKNSVFLDIINLNAQPDGDFRYIFAYVYMDTNFTLLRPIIRNCNVELASELVKILTSFGPPKQFVIKPNYEAFFMQVTNTLSELGLKCNIPIVCHNEISTYTDHIKTHMNNWMSSVGFENWGIGCQMMQMSINNDSAVPINIDMNNENVGSKQTKTPYMSMFMKDVSSLKNVCHSDPDSDKIMELNYYQSILKTTQRESQSVKDNKAKDKAGAEFSMSCHICMSKITKSYLCSVCQKAVHPFCSEKKVMPDENSQTYICLKCPDFI